MFELFSQSVSLKIFVINPLNKTSIAFNLVQMTTQKPSSNRKRVRDYTICLDKPLGKGAFGQVVLSYHTSNPEMLFATKIIDKRKISQKSIQQQQYLILSFKREFQIHSKLKHPNFVNLIEMHETVNNLYIIEEYCEGTTLKEFLAKRKRLEENQVLFCMKEICKGYSQLVKKGIIHRDLKPQNILISGQTLKICDFGFAKQITTQNQILTSTVGSPLYMAPQILNQQKYNSKCDVWSFGIIVQYSSCCMTRKYDFRVRKILIDPLKFPDESNISQQMQNFIQNCLITSYCLFFHSRHHFPKQQDQPFCTHETSFLAEWNQCQLPSRTNFELTNDPSTYIGELRRLF